MPIKAIPNKVRKGFTTIYNKRVLEELTTKQIAEVIRREMSVVWVEGVHYKPTQKQKMILKALEMLNSPNRLVFNNPETVTFK